MREKLLDLMKNEGLKPSQLAELLEINPAGISHILAGRNKPSFELLQKILRRFPRVNPDWLLLDAPQMYRPDAGAKSEIITAADAAAALGEDDLFSSAPAPVSGHHTEPAQSSRKESSEITVTGPASKDGSVARVIVLYSDHTFESFSPQPIK